MTVDTAALLDTLSARYAQDDRDEAFIRANDAAQSAFTAVLEAAEYLGDAAELWTALERVSAFLAQLEDDAASSAEVERLAPIRSAWHTVEEYAGGAAKHLGTVGTNTRESFNSALQDLGVDLESL